MNIAATSQKLFTVACDVIERPDLLEDERFAVIKSRIKNNKALTGEFQKEFLRRPSAEWIEAFKKVGVPVGPINTIADVLDDDPHTKVREMVVEVDHPIVGKMKTLGVPVKLSETPGSVDRAAPTLGQHTREILEELDYTEQEIQSMMDSESVRVDN